MSRGICFFAYNNEEIDYVKMATLAATFAKAHLDLPVALITDEGSAAWLHQSQPASLVKHCFDHIVITYDEMKANTRNHFDSPWTEFRAQFNNSNKHKIWEYSPFEQTILLDTDYIVKNDFLLKAFDTEGITMFDRALSLRNNLPHPREQWLYDAGIRMWWSTVVYFDRSDYSKLFFEIWQHVAENYDYYQFLYNFPSNMFRTDYCVSIAVHIMNGMQVSDVINNFFETPMYYMDQKDDLIEVIDEQNWIFIAHSPPEPWKNILVKHKNLDIHVMNKRALQRQHDQLMDNFYE